MVGEVRCARHRRRIFLEIVRRQHVIRRRDEGLEEPPGPARDQPQGPGVGVGHESLPATTGDRLVQRAIAGEAIQSAANGSASGQVPCPHAEATITATAAMTTPRPSGDRSREGRAADRSLPARP